MVGRLGGAKWSLPKPAAKVVGRNRKKTFSRTTFIIVFAVMVFHSIFSFFSSYSYLRCSGCRTAGPRKSRVFSSKTQDTDGGGHIYEDRKYSIRTPLGSKKLDGNNDKEAGFWARCNAIGRYGCLLGS